MTHRRSVAGLVTSLIIEALDDLIPRMSAIASPIPAIARATQTSASCWLASLPAAIPTGVMASSTRPVSARIPPAGLLTAYQSVSLLRVALVRKPYTRFGATRSNQSGRPARTNPIPIKAAVTTPIHSSITCLHLSCHRQYNPDRPGLACYTNSLRTKRTILAPLGLKLWHVQRQISAQSAISGPLVAIPICPASLTPAIHPDYDSRIGDQVDGPLMRCLVMASGDEVLDPAP